MSYHKNDSLRTRIRVRGRKKVTLYGAWAYVFYLHVVLYVLVALILAGYLFIKLIVAQ